MVPVGDHRNCDSLGGTSSLVLGAAARLQLQFETS